MTPPPTKCTWDAQHSHKDPHKHAPVKPEPAILSTILDHIGNTPLVRLNKLPKKDGVQCEVLAKCEFFNAGGSVKDRIARRMVEEAEKSGVLKPGYTIIEPTSGNTGIGLALAAAVKGYRAIITMPEKMSQEKVDVLRALGAEIIRTPTEAAFDSPESHIGVAKRLNQEIPNSVILDQYANPYNPIAHYDHTAEEILKSCGGKVDMFVAGAGTGGTISGIARKLKEKCPDCIVVGVDPHGSILAQPESLNTAEGSYKVEGIGYDFIPRVLDRSVVDKWYKSSDLESFQYSRRMIREEGLLCGGSSGSAMWAAMIAAKELKPGQRCVVLLPDSVRNYMTKFLNDDWMIKNGYLTADKKPVVPPKSPAKESPARSASPAKSPIFNFGTHTIADLKLREAITVFQDRTCAEAAKIMEEHHFDQLPVVTRPRGSPSSSPTKTSAAANASRLVGLVTLGNILSKVAHGRAQMSDPVSAVMFHFDKSKGFKEIGPQTKLKDVSTFLETNSAAVVTVKDPASGGEMAVQSVVTKFDLVSFMVKQTTAKNPSPTRSPQGSPSAKKQRQQ